MSDDLRDDPRQWLIYTEEPVTAAMMSVEVLALQMAGQLLKDAPDIELRAVGNVMLKWADARERSLSDGGMFQSAALDYVHEVFEYLGGGQRPDEALDQLHAAVFGFDKTLNSAGIQGDGWAQELARGEHGR